MSNSETEEISFALKVKEEILTHDINYPQIELMAVFKAIGNLSFDSVSANIEIKTTNYLLSQRVNKIINQLYPTTHVVSRYTDIKVFNKKKEQYVLQIQNNCRRILFDLGLIDNVEQSFIFEFNDVNDKLQTNAQKVDYISMFFCCSGSVNSPVLGKQYHLEINNPNEQYLQDILAIVKPLDINFKTTKRKSSYALYINKGEEVVDFLKFVRAQDAMFYFEDLRFERDTLLLENRWANAEVANEVRKMETVNKQIEAIRVLKEKKLFEKLSDKTKEVAELRIKFPDDSYNELASRTTKYTKSNLSYHLRILVKKYEELSEV